MSETLRHAIMQWREISRKNRNGDESFESSLTISSQSQGRKLPLTIDRGIAHLYMAEIPVRIDGSVNKTIWGRDEIARRKRRSLTPV